MNSSESIDNYLSDLYKLFSASKFSENHKIMVFVKGLIPELQDFVVTTKPVTLLEAIHSAKLKSCLLERNKTRTENDSLDLTTLNAISKITSANEISEIKSIINQLLEKFPTPKTHEYSNTETLEQSHYGTDVPHNFKDQSGPSHTFRNCDSVKQREGRNTPQREHYQENPSSLDSYDERREHYQRNPKSLNEHIYDERGEHYQINLSSLNEHGYDERREHYQANPKSPNEHSYDERKEHSQINLRSLNEYSYDERRECYQVNPRSLNGHSYEDRLKPKNNNFRPEGQLNKYRRLNYKQQFQRRGNNLFCNFCKTLRHTESECWEKQRRIREKQRRKNPHHTKTENTSEPFSAVDGHLNIKSITDTYENQGPVTFQESSHVIENKLNSVRVCRNIPRKSCKIRAINADKEIKHLQDKVEMLKEDNIKTASKLQSQLESQTEEMESKNSEIRRLNYQNDSLHELLNKTNEALSRSKNETQEMTGGIGQIKAKLTELENDLESAKRQNKLLQRQITAKSKDITTVKTQWRKSDQEINFLKKEMAVTQQTTAMLETHLCQEEQPEKFPTNKHEISPFAKLYTFVFLIQNWFKCIYSLVARNTKNCIHGFQKWIPLVTTEIKQTNDFQGFLHKNNIVSRAVNPEHYLGWKSPGNYYTKRKKSLT